MRIIKPRSSAIPETVTVDLILSTSNSPMARRGVKREARHMLKQAMRSADRTDYDKADELFDSARSFVRMAGFSPEGINLVQTAMHKRAFFREARYAKASFRDYLKYRESELNEQITNSMEALEDIETSLSRVDTRARAAMLNYDLEKDKDKYRLIRAKDIRRLDEPRYSAKFLARHFGKPALAITFTGGAVTIASTAAILIDSSTVHVVTPHILLMPQNISQVFLKALEGGVALSASGAALGLKHRYMVSVLDSMFVAKEAITNGLRKASLGMLSSKFGYAYAQATDLPHAFREGHRYRREFKKELHNNADGQEESQSD